MALAGNAILPFTDYVVNIFPDENPSAANLCALQPAFPDKTDDSVATAVQDGLSLFNVASFH